MKEGIPLENGPHEEWKRKEEKRLAEMPRQKAPLGWGARGGGGMLPRLTFRSEDIGTREGGD
jgi:hypothetical protein